MKLRENTSLDGPVAQRAQERGRRTLRCRGRPHPTPEVDGEVVHQEPHKDRKALGNNERLHGRKMACCTHAKFRLCDHGGDHGGVDATRTLAADDFEVSLLAPVRSPAVLDEPIGLWG